MNLCFVFISCGEEDDRRDELLGLQLGASPALIWVRLSCGSCSTQAVVQ